MGKDLRACVYFKLIKSELNFVKLRELDIDAIFVVYDQIPKDKMRQEVLKLVVPDFSVTAVTVDEAIALLRDRTMNEKSLLIFKELEVAVDAYFRGLKFTLLNLIQLSYHTDRRDVINNLRLSKNDMKELERLNRAKVQIIHQGKFVLDELNYGQIKKLAKKATTYNFF